MNKYAELAEKHIQWIALGIGGLWLLFMVYTYVIVAESSTVEVAGQTVGAASVDKVVREKADQLREKIERQDRIPDKVDNYAKLIEDQLKIPTAAPLPDVIVRVPAGTGVKPGTSDRPLTPVGQPVKALVKADKPANIDAVALRSVVKLPAPPQANGQQGGQPVEGDAQLLPYVVVAANFPMVELGKEFTLKIQQPVVQLHQTVLLKVELVREELLPDGAWSKPIVIPTHDFGQQQAPPEWPKNNRVDQMNYIQQVTANQPSLAQPKFVTAIRGDQWRLPGQPAAQVGGPNTPAAPPPEEQHPMPQPPKQGQQPGVRPPPNLPPGPPRNRRERSDADSAMPKGVVTIAQAFDLPPQMPGAGGNPGMGAAPAPGAAPVIPPANAPGEVPKVPFDPANANVFPMWVHDVTVVPGKTYRYRMRYTIKNPVFTANNVCQPPMLGDVFSIESELSDPTKAITIPQTTVYFAVNAPKLGREIKHVQFEIYTWTTNGLVQLPLNQTTAVPGDMIDPNLKVTLVDMRDDGRTIVLMDENGVITIRNVNVDAKSQDLADLRKMLAEQAIAPVAGR